MHIKITVAELKQVAATIVAVGTYLVSQHYFHGDVENTIKIIDGCVLTILGSTIITTKGK